MFFAITDAPKEKPTRLAANIVVLIS